MQRHRDNSNSPVVRFGVKRNDDRELVMAAGRETISGRRVPTPNPKRIRGALSCLY